MFMKIFLCISVLLLTVTSIAQKVETETPDSVSLKSRAKADELLKNFQHVPAVKMLYSVSDIHYYLILREKKCLTEYYILTDSNGNIVEKRVVNSSRRISKLLDEGLDIRNYDTTFITKVVNAKVVQGNPSYFVLKDIQGNRYGEFSLSVITIPIPISNELYHYLLSTLLKELSIEKRIP